MQASASVRKHPRSAGLVWDLCRTCVGLVSDLRRTCVGLASDLPETKIVAKRRAVVTFLRFVLQKCHRRDRETQSCRRVSKVSTVTGIGGVLVAKRRIVVTFGLALGRRVSNVSTVLVAKRRDASLLDPHLVASSTVSGIGGVLVTKCRSVVSFGPTWRPSRLRRVSSLRDRGGPGRETQNCRHF